MDSLIQLCIRITYFCFTLFKFRFLSLIPNFLMWSTKLCIYIFANFPREFLLSRISISIGKSYTVILGKELTPSNSSASQNWCSMTWNVTQKMTECKQPVGSVLTYAARFIRIFCPAMHHEAEEEMICRLHNPGSCRKEEGSSQAWSLTSNA